MRVSSLLVDERRRADAEAGRQGKLDRAHQVVIVEGIAAEPTSQRSEKLVALCCRQITGASFDELELLVGEAHHDKSPVTIQAPTITAKISQAAATAFRRNSRRDSVGSRFSSTFHLRPNRRHRLYGRR
jgi:hypothetical protein